MNVFETKRLDKNIPLPFKKHKKDAGYDIYAAETKWIWPFQTKVIASNHSILIENHLFGGIYPRSSMRSKGWLIEGVIDEEFTGFFKIMATNMKIWPRRLKKNERVCQIIFIRYEDVELEEVDEFSRKTERGSGGFGHTGKK